MGQHRDLANHSTDVFLKYLMKNMDLSPFGVSSWCSVFRDLLQYQGQTEEFQIRTSSPKALALLHTRGS